MCVLVFGVAGRARDWQRRCTLVGVTVTTLVCVHSPDGAVFGMLPMSAAFLAGSTLRDLRRRSADQAERLAVAEHESAVRAERAAVLERARIAREMHDILAHAVSLMVVQAEAGPVAVRSEPDRAIAAFDAIADSGRDAMIQLRRMLGVLKPDEGAPALAPTPTLDDLPALTDRVRRSGLRARVTLAPGGPEPTDPAPGAVREAVGTLPAHVEAAAFRIVQEALTNVVRHARARRVEVALRRTPGTLEVRVTDDGRGSRGGDAAGPAGRGLIGIRERAAACGGTATAGGGPGGSGFEVRALLPVDGGSR